MALDGTGRLLFRRKIVLSLRSDDDVLLRLYRLWRAVDAALDRSRAAILAIEDPSHFRNARTANLLGRAVGVCQMPAVERGLLVLEYRPATLRPLVSEVLRRYRSAGRWSPDEVVAATAALRALREPIVNYPTARVGGLRGRDANAES